MVRQLSSRGLCWAGVATLAMFLAPAMLAAQEVKPTEVSLFDAVKSRQVAVKVVADSYFILSLAIQNRTRQVLHVTAPEVFAAVPAARLAARGPASNNSASRYRYGHSGDDGGSQSLGGSFYYEDKTPASGTSAGLANADAKAGPKYKVAEWLLKPGQTVTYKIPCFCLEFGKPDPNARIPYVLVPLETLTKSRALHDLLTRFGKGKYPQAAAQLAMWHVANGATWAQLAQVRWPGRIGKVTLRQLQAAKQIAESLASSSPTE